MNRRETGEVPRVSGRALAGWAALAALASLVLVALGVSITWFLNEMLGTIIVFLSIPLATTAVALAHASLRSLRSNSAPSNVGMSLAITAMIVGYVLAATYLASFILGLARGPIDGWNLLLGAVVALSALTSWLTFQRLTE